MSTSAVARLLAAGWLLATATAHDRFAAMETGAILSPRHYHAAPAQKLLRRQDVCLSGNHPCNEIGDAGSTACCPDDSYCIINPTTTTLAACCPLGSTCDSPCPASQYQCATPITLSPGGTTTLAPACCPRRCPKPSMFGCPASLGSGCCSYGSVCAPPSQCLSTLPPATTSSRPLVLPVPPGCTTSQIACPSSLGGGCCADSQSCTLVAGAPHCADAVVTPTGSGVARADDADGLSTGAKTGIGVGVVGGFALVTGVLTFFFLRRRRARRRSEQSGGGRDFSNGNESETVGPLEGVAQGYAGPEPALGPYSETEETDGRRPGYYSYATTTVSSTPVVAGATPHGPGDITGAVELDSRGVVGRRGEGARPGRFELDAGGEGGPSPMTEGGSLVGTPGVPGRSPGVTPGRLPYEGDPWAAEGRR
ncbi:hypothetical protein QBC39DRAFT_374079 [Podospora conica]|nr:hypothetical protein QBC39DRAFT_374079 [Schizothecium conicum]